MGHPAWLGQPQRGEAGRKAGVRKPQPHGAGQGATATQTPVPTPRAEPPGPGGLATRGTPPVLHGMEPQPRTLHPGKGAIGCGVRAATTHDNPGNGPPNGSEFQGAAGSRPGGTRGVICLFTVSSCQFFLKISYLQRETQVLPPAREAGKPSGIAKSQPDTTHGSSALSATKTNWF